MRLSKNTFFPQKRLSLCLGCWWNAQPSRLVLESEPVLLLLECWGTKPRTWQPQQAKNLGHLPPIPIKETRDSERQGKETYSVRLHWEADKIQMSMDAHIHEVYDVCVCASVYPRLLNSPVGNVG